MIVGYGRTSTIDQHAGLEAQIRDLQAADCEKLFTEQVSSVATRAQLHRCLEFVREGDVLVITKLDRLARSTADALAIKQRLDDKGVGLIVLSLGGQRIDTRCATGKLIFSIMASLAEFERDLMLERQREGIAKAKEEGKYTGRKPTARAKAAEVRRLADDGWTRESIAAKLKIGVASVYRILADNKAETRAQLLNLVAKGAAK